ncbi:VOC family protein [Thalassolituus maritimus]|uniref:VOC family protein n=1 Tax=Thalassolituus maritimus TaxID=484498 RepID=A0ABQ0A0F8_9GAMM
MEDKLATVEIKAFVPAKDFELSKRFYSDLGFIKASDGHGVAYFHYGHCSFLLQDFYDEGLASNLTMHLLVESAAAWHEKLSNLNFDYCESVRVSELVDQDWGMREFTVHDPSGVLWRIAENIS